MSQPQSSNLDLCDVQATLLRPRPAPYRGQYTIIRVDDAEQGREMIRRLIPHVAPANGWWEPTLDGWISVVFSHKGLKALGLPQESLDSFPPEFQQGMAARAAMLNDKGRNAPEHWQQPFGSPDIHVALAIYAKSDESLQKVLEIARQANQDLPKVVVIYRLEFSELPGGINPFGFRDGLHNPSIAGSDASQNALPAIAGDAPPAAMEQPVKAGEFVLGYEDEMGNIAQKPIPEELRMNGTFVAFRKFYTDVAKFRRFLHDNASTPEAQELLAAKMVGRWRSGAPLVLAPEKDNPEMGADNQANNNFSYSDDMHGLKCPFGAHIRRLNPRDALKDDIVNVNLHKFIRRGTNYGPALPEGVMEDDGQERGGIFLLIGSYLDRQFEFIQS